MHVLEHFYYGQLVHHGKPQGEMRVLAKSAKVTDEHVEILLRHAQITPHPTAPAVGWGLVRTGSTQYYMTHAARGTAGQITLHAVILPIATVRALAGHVRLLAEQADKPMPTYHMLGDTLRPISFGDLNQRSEDSQVDDLLNLMTYTKNNTRSIEKLLSTVIQGAQLIVRHAPPDNTTRADFIQGLLTMLPSSTRFGVTFTLHSEGQPAVSSQITFNDTYTTDGATIYDWESGEISGEEYQSDYSRYMGSQLRLDALAVIQQAEELTPVAGWRYKSGDNLAEALAYASQRSRIDRAITQNQPVSAQDVARILANDPTLDQNLTRQYANHLLLLATATDDVENIAPLATAIQRVPELADTTLTQFTKTLKEGRGPVIFDMMHALTTGEHPLKGANWVKVIHPAAQAKMTRLLETEDYEGLVHFLRQVQSVPDNMLMGRIVPGLIEKARPHLAEHPDLAGQIISLGLTHLDDSALNQLLKRQEIAPYLSKPMKIFLLSINRREPAPESVMSQAARSLGQKAHARTLMRLAQMAYSARRLDLIMNTATLRDLARMAQDAEMTPYHTMLVDIVQTIEQKHLDKLDDDGARALLYIMLACKRYDVFAASLTEQSRAYYGAERQLDYIRMIQTVMSKSGLKTTELQQALATLQRSGIRDIPILVATCGALQASDYDRDMEANANSALTQLFSNSLWIAALPTSTLMSLLTFFSKHQMATNVQQVAEMLPINAADKDAKTGLSAINEAFRLLMEYPALKKTAFEMVRQYIRNADYQPAQRAAEYFGKRTGEKGARVLSFTATYATMTAKLEPDSYKFALRMAADFMQDCAEVFVKGARRFSQAELYELARSLKNQLNADGEVVNVKDELERLSRAVYLLGNGYVARHGKYADFRDRILHNQAAPACAVDMLFMTSGYITRGQGAPWSFAPNVEQRLLRRTPHTEIANHIQIATDILEGALKAYPNNKPIPWKTRDIAQELDGLKEVYPAAELKIILSDMADEMQRVADLVIHIASTGHPDALESFSRLSRSIEDGTHTPDNVMEFWRLIIATVS